MSWNNVLPWSYYARRHNEFIGRCKCGFEEEIQSGHMREDW